MKKKAPGQASSDKEQTYIQTCKSFFSNTSMHGLKYVTEEESYLFESIFWIVMFVSGSLFSAYFCYGVWHKWAESPILISFDSTTYPIKNLPFPGVTICSVNKVSKRALGKLQAYLRYSQVSAQDLAQFIGYMATLDLAGDESTLEKYINISNRLKLSVDELVDLMKSITPSYQSVFVKCQWESMEEDCAALFQLVPTDNGLCYAFNVAKQNQTLAKDQLRFAHHSGTSWGLSLTLNADTHDYTATSWDFSGFKVLVQDPNDFAYVGELGLLVSPGFETNIALEGYSVTAAETVANIALEKPKCALQNEIKLRFFDEYSLPNCQIECLVDISLRKCDCVPFFFAMKTNKNIPTCNVTEYACLGDAYVEVLRNCTCYPTCSDVDYSMEVSKGVFPGPNFVRSFRGKELAARLNLTLNQTDTAVSFKENIANVNIFFKKHLGLRYIMDARYSWEDFVSAMGGLLGLGIGFSIISAVEIIYFLALRWCFRNSSRASIIPNDAAVPPKSAINPIYHRKYHNYYLHY